MNKKELAEIKKNFSDKSNLFTLNTVLTAFVDAEHNVKCTEVTPLYKLSDSQSEVIMNTLKKSLSGTIGKNLVEYKFPEEAYEEEGAQILLYNVLQDKLENDSVYMPLISRIAENVDYNLPYAIIVGHCTYSVMLRDRNDIEIAESGYNYNYLVVSLCTASVTDDGLYYDNENCVISKKSNIDLVINKAPLDAFMFPCFSEKTADIHHVMYYSKSAKKPNLSVVEDILDCRFENTAEGEKELFHAVLTSVCQEELDYNGITKVNDILQEIVAQNNNSTEPPVVDADRMHRILVDIGISDEKVATLEPIYEKAVGNTTLRASNLIENKIVISAQDITVNIGKDAKDKVRTAVIQGKTCLLIDLDDSITINGIATRDAVP